MTTQRHRRIAYEEYLMLMMRLGVQVLIIYDEAP